MEKIIYYTIVTTGTAHELIEEVNRLIEKGYQPLGGVGIDKSYDFYQAVVKYEKSETSQEG